MAVTILKDLIVTAKTKLNSLQANSLKVFGKGVFGSISGDGSVEAPMVALMPKYAIPKNWVKLDGSYVPLGSYPYIYNKIGVKYGHQGTNAIVSPIDKTANSGTPTISGSSKADYLNYTAIDKEYIVENNSITAKTSDDLTVLKSAAITNAYKAMDGGLDTYASGNLSGGEQYIGYDLGSAQDINMYAFRIKNFNLDSKDKLPVSWKLQGSSDNTTWTDLDEVSGFNWDILTQVNYEATTTEGFYFAYSTYLPVGSFGVYMKVPIYLSYFSKYGIVALEIPVSSYRFFRLLVSEAENGDVIDIYEIYLLNASSIVSDYFKVFDGDDDTSWVSASNSNVESEYIAIDFGSALYDVDSYIIKSNYTEYGLQYAPTAWEFQASNDGTNWTVLETRNDVSWKADGDNKSFYFGPQTTNYRYYRIKFVSSVGNKRVQIFGLELFEETITHYRLPLMVDVIPEESMIPSSEGSPISGGDNAAGLKAKAFDDDDATCWMSSQTGSACTNVSYIGKNFNKKVPISRIQIHGSITLGLPSSGFDIQTSNDGTTWTTILTVTSYFMTKTVNYKDVIDYSLGQVVKTQYIRLLAKSGGMNLYGTPTLPVYVYSLRFCNSGELVYCMRNS